MIIKLSCSKTYSLFIQESADKWELNGAIQTCLRLRKDFFDVWTQSRNRKVLIKNIIKILYWIILSNNQRGFTCNI